MLSAFYTTNNGLFSIKYVRYFKLIVDKIIYNESCIVKHLKQSVISTKGVINSAVKPTNHGFNQTTRRSTEIISNIHQPISNGYYRLD